MTKEEILEIKDIKILEELSKSEDTDILEAVASNKFVTEDILDSLANTEDEHFRLVRIAVSQNQNTSLDTLYELAEENPNSVAKNPKTDEETLLHISKNAKYFYGEDLAYLDCLCTVVENKKSTEEVIKACIEQSKEDNNIYVIQSAIKNQNISSKFLEKLTNSIISHKKSFDYESDYIETLNLIREHKNITEDIEEKISKI